MRLLSWFCPRNFDEIQVEWRQGSMRPDFLGSNKSSSIVHTVENDMR
jgi:hypothetical protein